MKKTKVTITEQSRSFTDQSKARDYAKKLLEADVLFLEIKEVEE